MIQASLKAYPRNIYHTYLVFPEVKAIAVQVSNQQMKSFAYAFAMPRDQILMTDQVVLVRL